MTLNQLDKIFPFTIFIYGALLTFVLHSPRLMEIAESKFPSDLIQQLKVHRVLAIVCLVIGFFWSLQNIWIQPIDLNGF